MNTTAKALGVVSLVVVAAAVLVTVDSGTTDQDPTSSAPSATSSAPVAPMEPSLTASPAPSNGRAHDPAEKAQAETVEGFATRFSARTRQQRWLADLAPLVTPELLAGFEYTDRQARPQGKVAALSELHPVGGFEIEYSSGLRVRVTLAAAGERWRVASVEPVTEPLPQGSDV